VISGETADSIKIPFGVLGGVGSSNHVLDGSAHWRHLAITVEQLCAAAVSGSDAASSHITWDNIVFMVSVFVAFVM